MPNLRGAVKGLISLMPSPQSVLYRTRVSADRVADYLERAGRRALFAGGQPGLAPLARRGVQLAGIGAAGTIAAAPFGVGPLAFAETEPSPPMPSADDKPAPGSVEEARELLRQEAQRVVRPAPQGARPSGPGTVGQPGDQAPPMPPRDENRLVSWWREQPNWMKGLGLGIGALGGGYLLDKLTRDEDEDDFPWLGLLGTLGGLGLGAHYITGGDYTRLADPSFWRRGTPAPPVPPIGVARGAGTQQSGPIGQIRGPGSRPTDVIGEVKAGASNVKNILRRFRNIGQHRAGTGAVFQDIRNIGTDISQAAGRIGKDIRQLGTDVRKWWGELSPDMRGAIMYGAGSAAAVPAIYSLEHKSGAYKSAATGSGVSDLLRWLFRGPARAPAPARPVAPPSWEVSRSGMRGRPITPELPNEPVWQVGLEPYESQVKARADWIRRAQQAERENVAYMRAMEDWERRMAEWGRSPRPVSGLRQIWQDPSTLLRDPHGQQLLIGSALTAPAAVIATGMLRGSGRDESPAGGSPVEASPPSPPSPPAPPSPPSPPAPPSPPDNQPPVGAASKPEELLPYPRVEPEELLPHPRVEPEELLPHPRVEPTPGDVDAAGGTGAPGEIQPGAPGVAAAGTTRTHTAPLGQVRTGPPTAIGEARGVAPPPEAPGILSQLGQTWAGLPTWGKGLAIGAPALLGGLGLLSHLKRRRRRKRDYDDYDDYDDEKEASYMDEPTTIQKLARIGLEGPNTLPPLPEQTELYGDEPRPVAPLKPSPETIADSLRMLAPHPPGLINVLPTAAEPPPATAPLTTAPPAAAPRDARAEIDDAIARMQDAMRDLMRIQGGRRASEVLAELGMRAWEKMPTWGKGVAIGAPALLGGLGGLGLLAYLRRRRRRRSEKRSAYSPYYYYEDEPMFIQKLAQIGTGPLYVSPEDIETILGTPLTRLPAIRHIEWPGEVRGGDPTGGVGERRGGGGWFGLGAAGAGRARGVTKPGEVDIKPPPEISLARGSGVARPGLPPAAEPRPAAVVVTPSPEEVAPEEVAPEEVAPEEDVGVISRIRRVLEGIPERGRQAWEESRQYLEGLGERGRQAWEEMPAWGKGLAIGAPTLLGGLGLLAYLRRRRRRKSEKRSYYVPAILVPHFVDLDPPHFFGMGRG